MKKSIVSQSVTWSPRSRWLPVLLCTRTAMLSSCLASGAADVARCRRDDRFLAPPHRRRGLQAPAPSCSTRPSSCCSRRATPPSRRGGSRPKAGLKPQLVHYYFRTMDDLFLEVFRRRAEEGFAQLRAGDRGRAVAAHDLELADRRPAARRSTSSSSRSPTTARRSAPRSRATPNASGRCNSRRSHRSLRAANRCRTAITPEVVLVALAGVAQLIALERALGVSGGHDQALAFVEQYLDNSAGT